MHCPGENSQMPDKLLSEAAPAARDLSYKSSDGLTLAARDYGDILSPWLPVVCLSGLTRNGRDFEDLALRLAANHRRPRRVVTFDYRGRGRSQWDQNRDNYNPLTEMNDVLDGMTALGIPRAIIVGTSRGGIVAMLMAVARPTALAGVVLNDIGPVIEARGLARIKTYVGRTPVPDDWADAVHILKRLHGAQFPAWSEAEWNLFAHATFREDDGRPVGDYDPALGHTFNGVEFDEPVPSLWNEFRALMPIPVLVIRGENSDLLSVDTFKAMAASHPRLEAITVPGQGHPPLLHDPRLLDRISEFVATAEGATPPAYAVVPPETHNADPTDVTAADRGAGQGWSSPTPTSSTESHS
jgi:pimeloyl-ACP methyl ester carboxylesterase